MSSSANRLFISYRRDDASGYAGRLEEALERRFGRASVFRDVLDIPPGEDFIAEIRARLAGAQTVLVLIGPRWAGGELPGHRRIDDDDDFVRLEVSVALESGARVVPVLLPGAQMPSEAALPPSLQPLARRNSLSLTDEHWESDIGRLAAAVGLSARRRAWPWALGAAVIAAGAAAALGWLRPSMAPDPAERLVGSWHAQVVYGWGDRYTERFEFRRHAGQVTGTATFLAYPRAIEELVVEGKNLRFTTRTVQSMGGESREITHHYSAELRGEPPDDTLSVRMHSTGSFDSNPPLTFQARRVPAKPASAG